MLAAGCATAGQLPGTVWLDQRCPVITRQVLPKQCSLSLTRCIAYCQLGSYRIVGGRRLPAGRF